MMQPPVAVCRSMNAFARASETRERERERSTWKEGTISREDGRENGKEAQKHNQEVYALPLIWPTARSEGY